jgi:hypothetical protein
MDHAKPCKHRERIKHQRAVYSNVNCPNRLACLTILEDSKEPLLDCRNCVDASAFAPPDHTEVEGCLALLVTLFGQRCTILDPKARGGHGLGQIKTRPLIIGYFKSIRIKIWLHSGYMSGKSKKVSCNPLFSFGGP